MKNFRALLGLMLIAMTMLCFSGCGGGGSASGTVFYLNHKDGDGFTDMIRKSFEDKAKAAVVFLWNSGMPRAMSACRLTR